MKYIIENNLPVLLDWKNKKNHFLSTEPNYETLSYDFNDYGYRDSKNYKNIINNPNKIICIGCSFTFGIGLLEEETWPFKLSKKLGTDYVNLGFPGGSIKYVLWQLNNIYETIPNKGIFILVPPEGRGFELNDFSFSNNMGRLGVNESKFDKFLCKNVFENLKVNFLPYDFLGLEKNTKYFGFARDGQHYGEGYHDVVSDLLYKKYTE